MVKYIVILLNLVEVDCLRSTLLYKEHAVRKSITNNKLSYWFKTDALYTSCHDLISKYSNSTWMEIKA